MPKTTSPEILMVEASAGSGKTHALAKHYVKLLLKNGSNPSSIRDILAITFTKHAAREMKERILEFLKKIALNNFKNDKDKLSVFEGIDTDFASARKRSREVVDYIIKNYNYFQVQTIDSFVNMLLSGCSYRVGLSAAFKIKERYSDYLDYSLDMLIDSALTDSSVKDEFDRFITQYIYQEKKTNWLPKKNILNVLDSMMYHSLIYGKGYSKYEGGDAETAKQSRRVVALLEKIQEKLPKETNATAVKMIGGILSANSRYLDIGAIAKSKKLTSHKFPANKNAVITEELASLWALYLEALGSLALSEALSIYNCYTGLFNSMRLIFEGYSKKTDTIFLGELNSQASKLLSKNGITVPELYLRLSSAYKHYLIDEFQDTSVLRWRNISEMVKNALALGGTLFCVGDKKQAIFRFSGGDVNLTRSVKNELAGFKIEQLGIKNNYRSQKHIVEFNNQIFSRSNISGFISALQPEDEDKFNMLAQPDIEYVLDVFSGAHQVYEPGKEGGYVKIKHIFYDEQESKFEQLKEEVKSAARELSARFMPGEIAFICRKNSQVELVSGWLMQDGFAVESEKTLDIRNNFIVRELIAFLKFLNSPIDNLSFASFIMGDIFSARIKADSSKMHNYIFKLHLESSKNCRYYIYTRFREEYALLWAEYMEEFFGSAGFLGVYELAAKVIDKFDVMPNFPRHQGFAAHLLELIKQKEGQYRTLGDFIEYFEKAKEDDKAFYLNSSAENALKVLTIHKSKGLAFDAAVIPFLEISTNDLSGNKKGGASYALLNNENDMSLIKLDKKYAVLSDTIKTVYMSEYKKAIVDELDAVYVGFTRARTELRVFAPAAHSGRKNYALNLLPKNEIEYGKPEALRLEAAAGEKNLVIGRFNIWTDKINERPATIESLANRDKIKQGNIIHYMLSFVITTQNTAVEDIISDLRSKTRDRFPLCRNLEFLLLKVKELIQKPELAEVFDVPAAEVSNEKEFAGPAGEIKRFDRLIIKKDELWIIDYKTTFDNVESNTVQLEEYKAIARNIYKGKKARGFLISIEDSKMVEI